jgi:CubicO group peptidase (beta-lactamase class C family)
VNLWLLGAMEMKKLEMKHWKLFFGLMIALQLFSCHIPRAILWGKPDYKDSKRLPSYKVKSSKEADRFEGANSIRKDKFKELLSELEYDESFLNKSGTLAFIVIHKDTILYENYFHGTDSTTEIPIFSSAKSFTSALAGIAIKDGFIESTNSKVLDFIPELDSLVFKDVTIESLLNMNSGLGINMKGYLNLNRGPARYYYSTDFRKRLFSDDMFYREYEVGDRFEYLDLNAQLLGIIIERATNKSLAEYLEEEIWLKIGTENDASWAIADKKLNMTKAYCCLNATGIDLAKFGRLFLRDGNWNGEQIIPKDWVSKSVVPLEGSEYWHYSYMWWHSQGYEEIVGDEYLTQKDKNAKYYKRYPRQDASTRGLLGNYVYINPEKEVIIVRLGKKKGKVRLSRKAKYTNNWAQVFDRIASGI